MPKNDLTFDAAAYAPVAERIRLFYAAFPEGRIVTRLVRRTERDVVFRAAVYRCSSDRVPAATGWAAEREGDGDINVVACLENTETSAVGRALANLGFTASRERPSAEEMSRAARIRARLARNEPPSRDVKAPVGVEARGLRVMQADAASRPEDWLQREAGDLVDVLAILRSAERLGLRAIRSQRIRDRLVSSGNSPSQRRCWATLLHRWIEKRRVEAFSDPYLL